MQTHSHITTPRQTNAQPVAEQKTAVFLNTFLALYCQAYL